MSANEVRWTPQQRAAIDHGGGDLLVSAAAGSGKTAVLAERCARLVCEGNGADDGCGVEGLLVLTFTEAAANEMKQRIAGAIRIRLAEDRTGGDRGRWLQRQAALVERASISTLHAFCARVLRQHFSEAGIDPAFELMDEDEARLMREEALEEVLARWHALPPESAEGTRFAEFFEAYAEGSDGNCRGILLRVYHLLASTESPAAYIAKTRAAYAPSGRAATVGAFLRTAVGDALRVLALRVARACAEVRAKVGPDSQMAAGLMIALAAVEQAQRDLAARGSAALLKMRAALAYKWPTLKTLEDVPNFGVLKKQNWEKIKAKLRAFCEKELAMDVSCLERDLALLEVPLETLLALVDDFTRTFTAAKRAHNRFDFSDLERLTLDLITAPGSVARKELQQRYRHVLVDEFQDINPLQAALLDAVRSAERFEGRGNLFVVGDVKQAIYGFRLADPDLFLQRETAARAEQSAERAAHIDLPHNFRSQAKLLETMNGIFGKLLTPEIAGIRYGDGHALLPPPGDGAPNAAAVSADLRLFDGAPVEFHLVVTDQKEKSASEANESLAGDDESTDDAEAPESLSTVEEEARMVAARIGALMREGRGVKQKDGVMRPLAYRDIAILLRVMKNKALIFARALGRQGIPVHADLSSGYFDTTEVRDTLALLQIMDNPQQDIPLATALLGPYGRFSHDDLATIRLTYDRKKVSFADAAARYPAYGATVRSGVGDAGRDVPAFDAALARRLRDFFAKIAGWRELLRTRPLHEGLAAIYAESKILPYVAGLDAGTQRVANLQALHQRALRFSGFSKQGLHRFLRFIEKLRDQDGDFGEAPVLSEASDVVRILSIHKSKGLEFPVVIVAGLGAPPRMDSGGVVVPHRALGIGLKCVDVERNVTYPSALSATIAAVMKRSGRAEELRLLYVAMTRARDHLILTGHMTKKEKIAEMRAAWSAAGAEALPEDVLLGSKTYVDWVLPALASGGEEGGGLRVRWEGGAGCELPQVVVEVHAAAGVGTDAAETAEDARAAEVARILAAGEALPEAGATADGDGRVERLIERVTAGYAFEELARQPAVRTVSELKRFGGDDEAGDEAQDAPRPVTLLPLTKSETETALGAEALLRGTATHRVLERLDFTACTSAEAAAEHLRQLAAAGRVSAEDAAAADIDGITWFLTESTIGRAVIAAAARRAAGDTALHLRRELPFTWVAPIDPATAPGAPADWPTIRGTIDLLIVDTTLKTAMIVDYKTDAAFTWETNLPAYERQMRYYLRAASDILGFQVERATLAFFSVKIEREVRWPDAPLTTERRDSPAGE